MLQRILFFIIFSSHLFGSQDSAKLNDFEPVHILAAVKFPINQISAQDLFTQEIFKNIEDTFGPQGINVDAYQLEHIKKSYLYLIFLTKLEKVKKDEKFKQYQTDFAPFLQDDSQSLPQIPTAELLSSNGWLQVKIDSQDIANSTMWQLFCKSMITDINAYLIIGIKLIHNCEKQEFNYIPHFETSYYNQDYVQIRNINAVVRVKIELEQQVQQRYLSICNDWKKFSNFTSTSAPKLETQILMFQKTEFYQKTHNMHNLMGTQTKFNTNQKITHEDLLSAPALQSPLKEYVFGFFLLYELYGQLTSFMHEENLDQVITISSSSKLSPNIFPYYQEDYILISELLAGKNVIQDKPTNSVHPTIKTFKPEDLRNVKDWINPTRRTTDKYLQQKLESQKSVQAQSFLSFFSDVGHDIAHAAQDIKNGVEKACDAVKDFGESVGYGIAGFVLTIGGDTSEGNTLLKDSTQKMRTATDDLETSIGDFGSAIKEGIIAPVGELAGDIVGFVTDDKEVGADIDTVITSCADALVNIAQSALDTAAVALMYVYTLPVQIISALIETMIAAVVAIWNQQAALDICHSILRSLVTTFMMVAQVAKDDFHVIMSALGTFMNSVTTLFNDLIREITFIVVSVGETFADIAGADINIANSANKAADTAYNTLNQHRAIINQVIGVAVMIGADIVTGGAASAADIAIDSELEASLTETADQANEAISEAQTTVDNAETAVNDAKTPEEKAAAKTKLNEAKTKLKAVKSENEKILKQVKETRAQAQDTARQAKEEKEATTTWKKTKLKVKKFFRAYKNFLVKNKDIVTTSFGRAGRFFKGFKDIPSTDISAAEKWSSFKNFMSEPTDNVVKGLQSIKTRASSLVARAKNIPDTIDSLLEDGKNFVTRDSVATAQKSAQVLSTKIDDLTQAQKEFDQAVQNYSASAKNPAEFAAAQEKLLNATKALRQAELNFENAGQNLGKNLQKIGDQEKASMQDPLKVMKENAQQDVKTAEENLATEKEIGNSASVQRAKAGLAKVEQQLKVIEDTISKVEKPDALPADKPSVPLKQKISNKLNDALEYIQSKGKSFKNLLKSNTKIAEQAEANLAKQEENLKDLNTTLKDQKAALEKDPNNPQLQKDVDDTEAKINKQNKEIKNTREEARDARTKADETAKEKAARYLKNAFSPIGMFMNIAFNFTSIIGGYNQDQKNLLQQKQQEEAVQNLWRANTDSKISTAHTDLASLDEITEKQKASIGNQMLGLSLSQNYSYANLEQFVQTVQQTLAMIYTFQLHENSTTGLMAGNVGTSWGLISDYLNLYPSEGFYVATTGRTEFPYSQEVAQAPHLLTQISKTKTKQWFNQRCTAIDSKHKNGTVKQPTDALTVKLNFKILYTLDSEFYVGIYMGGSYHDYFSKTYLAALLGTTVDQLAQAYSELKIKLQKYAFNLNLIDINETYMAKMVVLYRESSTGQLSLGIYEQNLTGKEWLLQQPLPATMQLNQDHTYNLEAKLDQMSLQVTLSVDDNPQTTINQKVSVTPINNQRMYGIISSSAAITWNQITPIMNSQIANNVRKAQPLTLETTRNKENKLIAQEALNQIFGGKVLTIVSAHRARIFGQYIYASVQTDITKITPKKPADLLVFATNNNGTITNIGKAPNSFKDNATNVLVSLITGHVFDQKWNCISTVPQVWQNYNGPNSPYAPFLPTLQKTIEQQQKSVFSKLQYINFGPSFKLNAVSITALENGSYLYTSDQTLTDASGKPFTDYVVLAPNTQTNETSLILGLPPTAPNATTIVSLITGNIYEKNTKLTTNEIPTPTTTINLTNIINYLKQSLSSYSSIIFNQTAQYQTILQQKQQQQQPGVITSIESASSNATLAPKKNWFKPGTTFHVKFNFARSNLANRQQQAAASYKIQLNPSPKA